MLSVEFYVPFYTCINVGVCRRCDLGLFFWLLMNHLFPSARFCSGSSGGVLNFVECSRVLGHRRGYTVSSQSNVGIFLHVSATPFVLRW